MEGGTWEDLESTALGPGKNKERLVGGAGEKLTELLEKHHMFVVNSLQQVTFPIFWLKITVQLWIISVYHWPCWMEQKSLAHWQNWRDDCN